MHDKAHGHDKIIISDETILGKQGILANEGRLYKDASKIIPLLNVSGVETSVFFFIRNYSDFLMSSYGQSIKHGASVTFDDFIDRLDWARFGWLETVTSLRSNFEQVNIIKYEDFRTDQQASIDAMTRSVGIDEPIIGDNTVVANKSLSAPALEVTREGNRHLNEADKAKLVEWLQENLGHYPKLNVIQGELKKRLDDLYEEHCQIIS